LGSKFIVNTGNFDAKRTDSDVKIMRTGLVVAGGINWAGFAEKSLYDVDHKYYLYMGTPL
jgi:hypothetical protein